MKKKKLWHILLILAIYLIANLLFPQEDTPQRQVSDGESLSVHFIDVGQADCILLECGGEFMLIDGGNREDSQLVVSYLQNHGVEELEAVICTHAHEDHVGGLPGVLAVFPTEQVLAPTRTYASDIFGNRRWNLPRFSGD